MTGPVVVRVPAGREGQRLDVFLAQRPEIGSRSYAKALIQGGYVTVDRAVAKPGLKLEEGWEVSFRPVELVGEVDKPDLGPLPDIPVLYKDHDLLVVGKPAGIATHPPDNPRFVGHTVSGWARERFGPLPALQGEDRPGIVHRLDRDTSGVMVLACTEEAFHFLRGEFRARRVHKEYRALGYGEARFDSDHIERPIAPDPAKPDRMAVVAEGGRASSTYYEVVERFRGVTHFRCLPRTGRTHQIRVHMMSVGHSLVGDRLYRARRVQHAMLPPEAPDPGRHFLHALRLGFLHPRTRESLEFESPLAEELAALLRWLRAERS